MPCMPWVTSWAELQTGLSTALGTWPQPQLQLHHCPVWAQHHFSFTLCTCTLVFLGNRPPLPGLHEWVSSSKVLSAETFLLDFTAPRMLNDYPQCTAPTTTGSALQKACINNRMQSLTFVFTLNVCTSPFLFHVCFDWPGRKMHWHGIDPFSEVRSSVLEGGGGMLG